MKNTLQVLGSSSAGNCYLIDIDGEILILELGVKWSDVLKALNYDISNVSGALCTHKHTDHARYINKAISYGIDVYSCKEVHDINNKVKFIKSGVGTKIGGFLIQPISVSHSCECYAYIIKKNGIKILFVTDCNKFKYKVKNCTHILIEANYSNYNVIENAYFDNESRSNSASHMELEDTIKALKANYNINLQNILLLHLSEYNSDEELFRNKVSEELSFFNVECAKKGLSLELNKSEF